MKYKKNFKTTIIINKNNQLLEKQRNNIVGEETTDGERKDKTHSKVTGERIKEIYSKVTGERTKEIYSKVNMGNIVKALPQMAKKIFQIF